MPNKLNLEIITPSKKEYSGEIQSITIPGTLGSFEVLLNHAPLQSTFEIGVIKVVVSGEDVHYFATGGGTVEVLENQILLLADSIEKIEDIDVERARNALARAQERLSKRDEEKIDVTRAKTALSRAQNRLQAHDKFTKAGQTH